MDMPRDDIETLNAWDGDNVLHPWAGSGDFRDRSRLLVEDAKGIHVTTADGKRLIDGPGGMWCVQIGYGRDEIGQAMAEQATKLGYYSPFSNSNSTAAQLAHEIAKRTPGDLNTVFFSTGGSEAVDSAIRFVHFRNNVLGKRQKKKIISRQMAYHGSTYLSASLCGKPRDKNWFDTAEDMVHLLPDVNPYRRAEGQTEAEFLDEKVADLENAILEIGPDNTAAFIAEPILASGGVVIPPAGYHKRCLEICRKYDVLYISDEVVTGFGRLGHWFASEPVFDIVPDIITCAKGLTSGYAPMGATIISDRLLDSITQASDEAVFSNGFTYSGHPVCAAAALKNMEIIEREGILEHVRAVSPHFLERLHALGDLPIVGNTRGMGLVGCVECVADKTTKSQLEMDYTVGGLIDDHCRELGLMLRPLYSMCVFSPPLIITESQIDQMFDILEKGIRLASDDLVRQGLWKPAA